MTFKDLLHSIRNLLFAAFCFFMWGVFFAINFALLSLAKHICFDPATDKGGCEWGMLIALIGACVELYLICRVVRRRWPSLFQEWDERGK